MTFSRSAIGLLGWMTLVFVVAAVASQYMPGPWFRELNKPSWNPPSAVFGPVWTLLYTMMAVAAFLVWRKAGFQAAALPLTLFLVQLALNGTWSWLFFGLQRPALALVDIVVLWVAIAGTAWAFRSHSPIASAMLLPYLAWVSFATALNAAIVRLNP